MVVRLETQPVTMTVEPRPWMTTVEEVKFPLMTVVVAPEGTMKVGVLIEVIEVQTPAMQTKSAEGRVGGQVLEGGAVGGVVEGFVVTVHTA